MSEMTLTEYAQHRGVTERAVSTALQKGRISRNTNGWIDSEKADASWESTTNPRKSASNKVNATIGHALRKDRFSRPPRQQSLQPPPQPAATAAPVVELNTEMQQLATARAVREKYAALLAKIEYEERIGKMIDRDGVVTMAHSMHKALRDALMAIPDRLAAQLAAEVDAVVVHQMIEAEIRTTLEQVSSMRQNLAPRRGANREVAFGGIG